MAKKPTEKPLEDAEPTVLDEPGYEGHLPEEPENVWMRGLWSLMFIALMWVARGLVIIAALVQFFWMLFGKERNTHIADFGEDVADWLARATLYVTAATEDRPFPFDRWGIPD